MGEEFVRNKNMIYQEKPENFNPKFEVVGSFVQCNGEIVLLLRQDHKSAGNTWGLPSGKVDEGESLLDAICRETYEETGIIVPPDEMKFFSTVYVKYADYDLIYHMFYAQLDNQPEIIIREDEHKESKWATPQEALKLQLVEDGDECLKLFFGI